MKEAEIDILMQQNRMVKLIKSKFPTWVTEQKDEGVELVAGKFNAFRITKEGERDYNITCSQHVQKILDALQEKPEQKPEQVPATAALSPVKIVNDLNKYFSGERIIVPQDIEELKAMSTFSRILLFQRTDPRHVKERKGRGGNYKYVEGSFMMMEANIAFLFSMSSKIDGWEIRDTGVTCYGHITVDLDGKQVEKSGVGIDLQEMNSSTGKAVFTIAEMMKNAAMDMKKKALADGFGFNGDVYRGEV